jgi:Zn finger protein HypA/HybF involved in hydrogenase expression
MVAEVFAGLGTLKSALDLAKGLKDIDNATRRNAAVIELQEQILAAQQTQATLIETVGKLETEVARLKNWDADKARYELTELGPGVVALAIKEAMRNGEPIHRICANCATNGKKSYLQQHVHNTSVDRYKCNSCGEELKVEKGRSFSIPFAGGMDGPREKSPWKR